MPRSAAPASSTRTARARCCSAATAPTADRRSSRKAISGSTTRGDSAYQTYILIANPNATDAHVTITFLRENNAPPIAKTFMAPAMQRLTVPVGPGTDVPELTNERFGALIASDQPIAVERAMYADAGGQVWAAGTSANATPVP